MPGHKRNTELLGCDLPYDIDITEIHGFDNLHNPNGIIKNAMEKAKAVFHSENSYILVNGSTCGILSAIRCVTHYGDEIIIARNCHKSVYNGCELNGLDVHCVFPPIDSKTGINGSIALESIREALINYPNAKAVVITSPTYEGVISDIKSIADMAHEHRIPLIVDNAHGAHQGFCSFCKGEPMASNADIVISSLHKTLPTLTQTAIAHVGGNLINPRNYERQLAVFETSSPSYVLMASVDRCLDFLVERKSEFSAYEERLKEFSERVKALKNLTVLCHGNDNANNHSFYSFDLGKIVICTNRCSLSGVRLSEILREKYQIELEMAYSFYAVAMTSVCDTKSNFERLANALIEIDSETDVIDTAADSAHPEPPILERSEFTFANLPEEGESIKLASSVGRISLEYIFAYPPGIPLVVPGELINEELVSYINALSASGVEVQSSRSNGCDRIFVTL